MDSKIGLDAVGLDAVTADETSQAFLGRWQGLVSTTNWEKGRIIYEWRQALMDSGASPLQYSDEAWSRRIGQVTGQHAGRLRRVYERFQSQRDAYSGLYWSHFQAALDWSDAEMWLEGAVQNDWSISDMRAQRIEAFGGPSEPMADDDVAAEVDEDAGSLVGATTGEVRMPSAGSDFFPAEIEDSTDDAQAEQSFDSGDEAAEVAPAVETVSPFDNLRELPADLSEAFDSFKLAILRHKLSGWQEIGRGDVLASLDALKQLALAPAE